MATHIQTRKVPIPPHRFTPLKAAWSKIYPPLVEHLKLQVRMNVKNRRVELRTSRHTTDVGALQKGEDFVHAFALGFDVDDAVALLRLDDLEVPHGTNPSSGPQSSSSSAPTVTLTPIPSPTSASSSRRARVAYCTSLPLHHS